MAKSHVSQKRTQIDKANAHMVATIAAAAFVIVFAMVASRTLWQRQSYQSRVIGAKEQARDQLRTNIAKVDELVVAYKAFVGTPENAIGGNPTGKGDVDGDNAKIILDALPSKYDFPGLTTSLEKIMKRNGNTINSITGTDDEIAQGSNNSSQPIAIPFELSAGGSFRTNESLLLLLQRSIRPIKLEKLAISGTNAKLAISVTATTYYQPEKTLNIQKKVIR